MLFRRQPDTVFSDVRDIRRSAIRTVLLVVFLLSGAAPAFCMWWDFRGDVPWQHQWETLRLVAVRTYPLTVSIAVIAMSRQLGWFRYGRLLFMGAVITLGAGLGDVVSTMTGSEQDHVMAASVVPAPNNLIFGPITNSFNYLVGYYQLYGARYFFSAILVGSFAGRTASKIVRRLTDESDDARDEGSEPSIDVDLQRAA